MSSIRIPTDVLMSTPRLWTQKCWPFGRSLLRRRPSQTDLTLSKRSARLRQRGLPSHSAGSAAAVFVNAPNLRPRCFARAGASALGDPQHFHERRKRFTVSKPRSWQRCRGLPGRAWRPSAAALISRIRRSRREIVSRVGGVIMRSCGAREIPGFKRRGVMRHRQRPKIYSGFCPFPLGARARASSTMCRCDEFRPMR